MGSAAHRREILAVLREKSGAIVESGKERFEGGEDGRRNTGGTETDECEFEVFAGDLTSILFGEKGG